jgi:hypothetical protein
VRRQDLQHVCAEGSPAIGVLCFSRRLEGKKDATASPLRVRRRAPLRREESLADDRGMRVAAWETLGGVLANDGQSQGVGHIRTGAELYEDSEVHDHTLPK